MFYWGWWSWLLARRLTPAMPQRHEVFWSTNNERSCCCSIDGDGEQTCQADETWIPWDISPSWALLAKRSTLQWFMKIYQKKHVNLSSKAWWMWQTWYSVWYRYQCWHMSCQRRHTIYITLQYLQCIWSLNTSVYDLLSNMLWYFLVYFSGPFLVARGMKL